VFELDDNIGHSVMTVMKDGKVWAYDPNGQEHHTTNTNYPKLPKKHSCTSSSVVIKAIETAWTQLGWTRFRCWHPFREYSDWYRQENNWLLDSDMHQSTVTMFLNSQGLCGAFSAYIASLLVLNPSCTRDSLRKFLEYRQDQWQKERIEDKSLRDTISALRAFEPTEQSQIVLDYYTDLAVNNSLRDLLNNKTDCYSESQSHAMQQLVPDLKRAHAKREELKATLQELKVKICTSDDMSEDQADLITEYNKFIIHYNKGLQRIEDMETQYNALIDVKRDTMKLENTLVAAEECRKLPHDLKEKIFSNAWNLLSHMNVSDPLKVELRKKMIDRGIFLNFLEVQIFSFIKYCKEF
jgi:hypothetical protein